MKEASPVLQFGFEISEDNLCLHLPARLFGGGGRRLELHLISLQFLYRQTRSQYSSKCSSSNISHLLLCKDVAKNMLPAKKI